MSMRMFLHMSLHVIGYGHGCWVRQVQSQRSSTSQSSQIQFYRCLRSERLRQYRHKQQYHSCSTSQRLYRLPHRPSTPFVHFFITHSHAGIVRDCPGLQSEGTKEGLYTLWVCQHGQWSGSAVEVISTDGDCQWLSGTEGGLAKRRGQG